MRKHWKEEDIIPGTYIIRVSCPEHLVNERVSFACTVTFKIGWDMLDYSTVGNNYSLISCFTDGLVLRPDRQSKQALANQLNYDRQGYRLLTKAEYMKMAEHVTQGLVVGPVEKKLSAIELFFIMQSYKKSVV